jgi:hydroxyacylglutathione hydrolase
MLFRQIEDPKLAQYAYLIGCQRTGEVIVVDPERDVDRYLDIAAAEGLRVTAVAETHIHADFLSGARELAERVGAKLYLSDEGDADWKSEWAVGAMGDGAAAYDVTLLHHGDTFRVGNIELRALHTPGHTPEHLSFLVTDHGGGMSEPMGILSGDFVFVGDLGRPDLLESAAGVEGVATPSAERLYDSAVDFLELPDFLQVWPAHGAGSACGKALGAVPMSTVGYERRGNPALDAVRRGRETFVDMILDGQPEPPLYFARMKRLNKEGVPLLGELPTPALLGADELTALLDEPDVVVVDTRLDRTAFMDGHLPGSIYAPLNKTFPTIAGSYVQPNERIVLVIDEDRRDEVVRDLVRVGLDRIEGFAPPAVLSGFDGLEQTPTIDFAEVERLRTAGEARVLDVRGASEHAAGHVPGAANIAHTRLLDRLDEIDGDGPLLVHCKSGARAASAVSLLAREGFDVRYVDDAFARYREQEVTATATS